jgi:hypothetical protein
MMKTNDLENELRNLKFTHLTEIELSAYCDQELDKVRLARVEAHLKQCFICERQLALLREERAALNNGQIAAKDIALVERLMEQMKVAQKSPARAEETIKGVPLQERLVEYLRQMAANWQTSFATVRHSDQGKEVWQWQSEDGRLRARATMEENADMLVHFSSNEMELEGARLHFRLGSLSQELTLRRISESQVAAQVAIPWPYRQGNMMADIAIELI